MIDIDDCDYLISVEYINWICVTIFLIFFITRINILHKQKTNNDFDDKTLIYTMETSYTKDDKALKWL